MRRLLRILLFIGLTARLGAADSTGPTEFAVAGIGPIVTPMAFHAFLDDLQLEPGQREAARFLLEDYGNEMRGVLEALRTRQAEDRARLDQALSGTLRLKPDELRSLRISLQSAVAEACSVADQHVDRMVEWAILLSTASDEQQHRAIGRLHRTLYLDGVDRSALVDISHLAQEAVHEELAGVDPSAVDAALGTYAASIAGLARADALAHRAARFDDGAAAIRGDQQARIELQRESAARWSARMQLQDTAVEAVAALLSPEAADVWRLRTSGRLFPSIYEPIEAERASKWIKDNGSFAQGRAASTCLKERLSKLESLRREAESLLREGRRAGVDLDHEASAHVESAIDLRMRYLRNSGERSVLVQEMLDCVLRPLTEGQRAAVDRILRTGQ